MDFNILLGKTITNIVGAENGCDEIIFTTSENKKYKLFHNQDCCEYVSVEDICGDSADLIGHPILLAEEVSGDDTGLKDFASDSENEWTFYKLSTIKGSVTIRWYGTSNGYYSTDVSFEEIK